MSNFSKIKNAVKAQFERVISDRNRLYFVQVDRDQVWELYLSGFPEPVRQEYNCNCCKSFFRQFAGIVAIHGDKMITMFDYIDFSETPDMIAPLTLVNSYIHSLPITDVFVHAADGRVKGETLRLGTDTSSVKDSEIVWHHFNVELPKRFLFGNKDGVDTEKAKLRDDRNVLKRSLEEIKLEAVETVLELIAQGSLYRGNEFAGQLTEFARLHRVYNTETVAADREVVSWDMASKANASLCRIRNSAIGTLLNDLSEGMDLDAAVSAFERVMAPSNYKRPTSLITPAMIEKAKARIAELGLTDALARRFAVATDINVNDMLFADRNFKEKDVFSAMKDDVAINPKTLSKVEEVHIDEFLNSIVYKAKEIELLLENKHLSNFVSLIAPEDKNAASMFKWRNPFSWSYTGGIADAMKERVKAAGGNVDGVLRFSIQWNEDGKSIVDLDAHAKEPIAMGKHIYYGSYNRERGQDRTPFSGQLDVDMRSPKGVGVENIVWTDQSKMKSGVYKFFVNNYNGARHGGFKAQIEFDGQIHEFSYPKHFENNVEVAEVTYRDGVFSISSNMDSTSSVASKDKWGVKTHQFIKVKGVLLSPNHWSEESGIGNAHTIFLLDGCVSDEKPRPFYNEFLKQELDADRKVFEVLAGKLAVSGGEGQLSGVGFSDTVRNSVIARVTGTFTRTIKINF